MDFAPYQSSPPEASRPTSPRSPRTSLDANIRRFSPSILHPSTSNNSNNTRASPPHTTTATSPPLLQHPQPQRASAAAAASSSWLGSSSNASNGGAGGGGGGFIGGGMGSPFPEGAAHREGVSEFDTSLGIRLDYEACLAYLALPPLGGIFLLIAERNSDYVRFHAWQSSLLFTFMLMLHLLLSWSSFLGWLVILADVVLAAALTARAYQDADTLDRYEVPVFGQIASRFLDDE